jgi:hypothetical protein
MSIALYHIARSPFPSPLLVDALTSISTLQPPRDSTRLVSRQKPTFPPRAASTRRSLPSRRDTPPNPVRATRRCSTRATKVKVECPAGAKDVVGVRSLSHI